MEQIIRNKVFETNSSSTHSITIEDRPENNSMIVGRQLICDNLINFVINSDDSNWILICDTPEKKAAFIYAYMQYHYGDVKELHNFILSTFMLVDIELDINDWGTEFLIIGEYNDMPEDIEKLKELITNKQIIVSKYEEY